MSRCSLESWPPARPPPEKVVKTGEKGGEIDRFGPSSVPASETGTQKLDRKGQSGASVSQMEHSQMGPRSPRCQMSQSETVKPADLE